MLFQIISDIHLEFDPSFSVKKLFNKNSIAKFTTESTTESTTETTTESIPEINLIIAGDLGWPTDPVYKKFLIETTKYYDNIFLITGNHEYYCCKKNNLLMPDVDQLIINIVNEINSESDKINLENRGTIHFLNNQMIQHNGVWIVGSTLWTFVDDKYKSFGRYMNDYNYIKNFTIDDSNQLYLDSFNFIKNSIEQIKQIKQIKQITAETSAESSTEQLQIEKCIVITHHLPTFKIIHPKYKDEIQLNSFFASNSDELINDPVLYWIYGHTHSTSQHEINSVKVLCNPKGYPSERSEYKNECIIEIN